MHLELIAFSLLSILHHNFTDIETLLQNNLIINTQRNIFSPYTNKTKTQKRIWITLFHFCVYELQLVYPQIRD